MENVSDDSITEEEEWEKELEEAIKEANDIIANPQNYKFYKTVDEMWEAMEKENEMEEALRQSNDIIANPQNYPAYETIAELRAALDAD